jgi:hypothetical protein
MSRPRRQRLRRIQDEFELTLFDEVTDFGTQIFG